MTNITPVLLLILDGFGHRLRGQDNAILKANTPFLDQLRAKQAYGTISTSGLAVGLPQGQFGNSEVGHIHIGAGRVVKQEMSRIEEAIENKTFAKNPVFVKAFECAKNHALHIFGLLSDGGVHSHEKHIHALIKAASEYGVKQIHCHVFLDGRDVPPKSAKRYLKRLSQINHTTPGAHIATLCGRYWAMDRDQRWDRIERAYRLIVEGKAPYQSNHAIEAIQLAYARNESDEFIQPSIIGKPCPILPQDAVIFMNFRADRARELTEAITAPSFSGFDRQPIELGCYATLTSYGENFPHPCAYPVKHIQNGLGEYIASLGLKQLRIAETEKFAHVTYFFNGGRETQYPLEKRILISSPKIATYDLQPQMNAKKITDKLIQAIISQQFTFLVCNFANGDMVGHTGNFEATIKAVETLDQSLKLCVPEMLAQKGEIVICADHGNCEQMYDANNQQPHTQHTTNPSPFFYIGRPAKIKKNGSLKDVAPSILDIMGLAQPKEMTGRSLIQWL